MGTNYRHVGSTMRRHNATDSLRLYVSESVAHAELDGDVARRLGGRAMV